MKYELRIMQKKFAELFMIVSPHKLHDKKGFTLIELMLVIALISSVGLMTTAYMARFLTQNAVQNTQDQIIGDLRKAQFYTMMGKQRLQWGVHYASNTITLYGTTTDFNTGHNTAFDETFSVNTTVSISGLSDILFSGATGTPNPPSASITVTGSTSNTTKSITMNAQGMVTR